MKKFNVRWFRAPDGRYLSAKESDKSVLVVYAADQHAAEMHAAETEDCDSEIPFNERVSINELD